ncbi:hypothetical protein PV355_01520 [Streptomyces stelliscabiei]|uniref:hypothetical protein n=1 Tax=Streptomyces stelliscabiei TaxID=146820 RepID=UPI0029AD7A66|nr:hypothetical protein [Streptomyces stelliscabiei]MDX2513845.1 hypothetical protein [Streptomyces stelliscabiei]
MSVCTTCLQPGLPADGQHDCPGIGEIQVSRHRGRGVVVDAAPARALIGLRIIRDLAWPANIAEVGDPDLVNIADQVLYRVVGYEAGQAALIVELVEDWRPAPTVVLSEADVEELKARWREAYGKPGSAHVVTEIHATEPRNSSALDRVRALEARLWEATDGRAMPVSAVCHSIANDLRFALNPPPEEDNPPVQCWHTEPDTPCDWDVCRQPERLAAGDRGTDPARKEPS